MKIKNDNKRLIISPKKIYTIPRIKDLPNNEKPREKLLLHGVKVLSSAELLAIVLSVGTKKEEVFSMASRLLKEYGEQGIVYQKKPKTIQTDLNLPLNKACQIVACFELGRRFYEKNPSKPTTIRNAKQAFQYLKDMRTLNKEQLRGLYLNSHYELIHDEVIAIGTLNTTIIQPREVFQPAIEYSAAAIIIAHNHPSGKTCSNNEDINTTKKLVAAGKILAIEVLDHLIIGKENYTSLL